MRLGILGGTFDPIHLGHLILADEAIERLGLNRVIFVPAYIPPHKKRKNISTAVDRLKMVELAIKGNKRFGLSTFEINAKGKSYTIDTLKHFQKIYGSACKFFFITGSDSLKGLYKWKDIEGVLRLSNFVVAKRPGYDIKGSEFANRVIEMNMTPVGISSSGIRAKAAKGLSVRYLLPHSVFEYIKTHELYLKIR